jgi:NADH-quinone oxidoreductase subunit C
VPVDKVYVALEALKYHAGFDLLVDITAVDYLHYPDATDRYGVIYCLTNTTSGERVVVKTFVNDPEPVVPSVYSLWRGADWMEREVYDLYGITFTDHPDLRRILMPDGFVGYPLRKDYPLRGYGERHNFTPITRAEG